MTNLEITSKSSIIILCVKKKNKVSKINIEWVRNVSFLTKFHNVSFIKKLKKTPQRKFASQ